MVAKGDGSMKKRIICTVLLLFLVLSMPVFATSSTIQVTVADVKINIDGTDYGGENPIINYNGYNYVPVGELGRALGADVYWISKTRTIEIFTKAPSNFTQMKALNRLSSYYHMYYSLSVSDISFQHDIMYSIRTRSVDVNDLETSYKQIGNLYTSINKNLEMYNETAQNINVEAKFNEIDNYVNDALVYHGMALDYLYKGMYNECIEYETKAINSMYAAESLSNDEYYKMVRMLDEISYK